MSRMGLLKNKKATQAASNNLNQLLHQNLEFTASEQYRLLRSNIRFTLPSDVDCPIIGITSSTKGEGKSTTAVNLSYMLSEEGGKVLLIDGDLRLPSINVKMELDRAPGLTDFLLNPNLDIEKFKSNVSPNWYILPSGELPPNPSELLGSTKVEQLLNILKQKFDFIIIDVPPVNLVSDVMSISKYLTGMILVIREEYGSKRELATCVRQIKLSNVNVLGCVMQGCRSVGGKYGKYKYKYKEYGYGDHQEKA